jgi:outer membrane immunogenic protein
MKKLLLGSAALAALIIGGPAGAADMPAYRKAPPPMVAPYYNWSGFYVGGFVGADWGKTHWTFVNFGTTVDPRLAGALAGAAIGFNYQVGAFVLGAEVDHSWTNAKGSALCPNPTFTCHSELNHFGTFTGKLGYAWDNILTYVKGGGAWGGLGLSTTANANGLVFFTGNENRGGWTVGTGFEIGFTPNWSGKVEYNYLDFGTHRLNAPLTAVAATEPLDLRLRAHALKVGVNYRFSYGPVYANY